MATANGSQELADQGASALKITKRPWDARGFHDLSWLYAYHTFSFVTHHDPEHEKYGPLHVFNEDRVQRGTGFGTHSHAEYLIWSYVVSGELEHRDSMGNLELLTRDDVQFTSAGTGIQHSEYNRNKERDLHFIQVWAKPSVHGLTPSYSTRRYPEECKRDRFVRIMESVDRHSGKDGAQEPIALHADVSMSASILSPGKTVEHELVKNGPRNVYVHVIMSGKKQPNSGGATIKLGDVEVGEGDGAYIRGAIGPGKVEIASVGEKPAEFLLFDMGD